MSSKLQPHKFSEFLPLMSEPEFASLKADLAVNPQREKVILFKGEILDGRNRYRALTELGKKVETETFKGTEEEALQYVYSKANHRHMSESQKAAAAVNFLAHFEKSAKGRQQQAGEKRVEPVPQALRKLAGRLSRHQVLAQIKNGSAASILGKYGRAIAPGLGMKISDIPPIGASRDALAIRITDAIFGPEQAKSRDQAGGLFGVSGRYVQDAKLVFERDPKLFRQVFDGSLPLTRAKRIVHRTASRKAMAKMADLAPAIGLAEIITGDCIEQAAKQPRNRFRLIFADPPYNIGYDYEGDHKPGDRNLSKKSDLLDPEKYLAWCQSWMAECYQILSIDGSMWVLINDEWAAQFKLMLEEEKFIVRAWIKWYETFGVNCSNNFNRTSRHLFYCVKSEKNFVFNHDAFSRPSDRQSKYKDLRAAEGGKMWDDVWQIPRLVDNAKERVPGVPTQLPLALVEPIVLGCTEPGDKVFDPFTGSGTTAVAAVTNGREFIGTEKNEKFAELARLRVRAAIAGKSKE